MDEGLGTINDGSDICIRCAPYDFRVHKAVVYPQSGVFAFAFDGEFPTDQIILNDDPETVERMVCYFYNRDYDDYEDALLDTYDPHATASAEDQASIIAQKRIVNNIDVYALAEKYDLPNLRALAKAKFTALVCHMKRPPDFAAVLRAVYDSDVEHAMELRRVVSRICTVRLKGNVAVKLNDRENGVVKGEKGERVKEVKEVKKVKKTKRGGRRRDAIEDEVRKRMMAFRLL